MPEQPATLIQQLTRNQFSRISIGAMLVTLRKVLPVSSTLININVNRYKANLTVAPRLPQNAGLDKMYQWLFEAFPTFPFVISSQLKSQPTHLAIGQQLQICQIGSTAIQYHEKMPHIEQFLKQVDASVEITQQVAKGAEEPPYLPRLVYRDLILIAKGLHLQPTAKRPEMIENLYCINGVLQIFLRYYYDLISAAETDEVAEHIHGIFFNFFTNIRLQELQYWKNYSSKTKGQIEQIIAKDAHHRHPILRRPFFEQLQALNPIIHNGTSRQMTISMKTLLDKQIADFRGFSLKKMGFFLQTLAKCKAPEYPRYLILQVLKENPKKIVEFYQFCQSPEAAAPMPVELEEVLLPIVQQITPSQSQPTVVQDETSRRQKTAFQNMQKRAHVAAMTSAQLEGHFQRYLNRLYEKSAKEGALTQADIAKHLARLSQNATKMIQRARITLEEKKVFEESVDDILHQMGSQLNEGEMGEFEGEVRNTLEGFEKADIEERVEKIEELGCVINAASEMSNIKLEAKTTEKTYTDSLALNLQIDDNPAHVVTIRELLEQPISQKDKMQYLKTHTPDPISPQMLQVIEKKQQFSSQGSADPISIFKGETLLPQALTGQLFPETALNQLLKKPLIPILTEENQPPLTVREFFTFPFAEKKQGPAQKSDWFKQHIFYLELAHADGKIEADDLQAMMENVGNFPMLEYKKYFNIVRRKKFEDTVFMAVYFLWQNNGLDKLRIPAP